MIAPNTTAGCVDVIRTHNGETISFVASEVYAIQVRQYKPGYRLEKDQYDVWVYLKGCPEEMWVDSSNTLDDANRKKDEFLRAVKTIKDEAI